MVSGWRSDAEPMCDATATGGAVVAKCDARGPTCAVRVAECCDRVYWACLSADLRDHRIGRNTGRILDLVKRWLGCTLHRHAVDSGRHRTGHVRALTSGGVE